MRLKRLKNGMIIVVAAAAVLRISEIIASATYSKKGPFVNLSAPGIDQAFLNGLEQYLNASVANCGVPIISKFNGTGSGAAQVVSHNLHDQSGASITPDVVIIQPAGNFGGPPANVSYYYNTTSTQVTVVVPNGISYNAIALKF